MFVKLGNWTFLPVLNSEIVMMIVVKTEMVVLTGRPIAVQSWMQGGVGAPPLRLTRNRWALVSHQSRRRRRSLTQS